MQRRSRISSVNNPLGFVFALTGLMSGRAHADLIVNGGFEGGVYTSTIVDPSFGTLTNNAVPLGWTSSAGFDFTGPNGVTTYDPHTGTHALFIGNQGGPVATLSQTFGDTTGALYQVSFYLSNIAANSYFSATVGGSTLTLTFPSSYSGNTGYVPESVSFVGTGSDTLSFSAVSLIESFLLDDVSVSGPGPISGAPGPTAGGGLTGLFFAIGCLLVWWRNRRLRYLAGG